MVATRTVTLIKSIMGSWEKVSRRSKFFSPYTVFRVKHWSVWSVFPWINLIFWTNSDISLRTVLIPIWHLSLRHTRKFHSEFPGLFFRVGIRWTRYKNKNNLPETSRQLWNPLTKVSQSTFPVVILWPRPAFGLLYGKNVTRRQYEVLTKNLYCRKLASRNNCRIKLRSH